MNSTIIGFKMELIKLRRDLSDAMAFHRSSVAESRNKTTSLDKDILKLRKSQNKKISKVTKELRSGFSKVGYREKQRKS